MRVANYQAAMGTYQRQLWDKILLTLQVAPEAIRSKILNTYTEASTLAKQQRIATRHTADAAMSTSIALRRHVWLCSSNILDDTKTQIEDLPFDATSLFNSKTDELMENIHKIRKTAHSALLVPTALPVPNATVS